MDYRIIVDTSCELLPEMKEEMRILSVPFRITIDGVEYVDENLELEKFLQAMRETENPIVTSCPSPHDYLTKFEMCEEDTLFVITISSKLSGSFNSAMIARDQFLEEHPEKEVYVVDSESASAGHTAVVLKIYEILNTDENIDEKLKKIGEMVSDNRTYFILERLDNLIKNGRINKHVGKFAMTLNIKPVMKGVAGEIGLQEINRSFKKSLKKLSDLIGTLGVEIEKRTLVVSHVDAKEKAQSFVDLVKEKYNFKDIKIIQTNGLSSGYADIGGIVVGF